MDFDFSGPPPQAKTLEEAQGIINALWAICREMKQQIRHLEARVKTLEENAKKNSSNSSKPPSSDGFQKPEPKSLRGKSGKNKGGQPGHERHRLEKHANPDEVIHHPLSYCARCQKSLKNTSAIAQETRQVFDIPSLKIIVTEHQTEQKICPGCRHKSSSSFPRDVQQPTQYGSRLKSLATYLNQYQFLSYDRLQDFFDDIFKHKISQGMLVKINRQCHQNLDLFSTSVKDALQISPHMHHDETGIRVDGKLHWCHVASTSLLTDYGIHKNRGKEGINASGILPNFKGRLIHDFFRPYFSYDCSHGLCNAHHLRELKYIEDVCKQEWAKHMMELLLAIKKQIEWYQERNISFPENRNAVYERCYDEIIMMGLWHPDNIQHPPPQRKKRGYSKQSKAKNLLDRLRFHRPEVLAFMYDHSIPFTNNQAEQDIRMLKVKQKVSGCFRSQEGAQWFARVRGYISTAKKQGKNILQALQDAFNGNPFTPQTA